MAIESRGWQCIDCKWYLPTKEANANMTKHMRQMAKDLHLQYYHEEKGWTSQSHRSAKIKARNPLFMSGNSEAHRQRSIQFAENGQKKKNKMLQKFGHDMVVMPFSWFPENEKGVEKMDFYNGARARGGRPTVCTKCRKFWDDLRPTATGKARIPIRCNQYDWNNQIEKADRGEPPEDTVNDRNLAKGLRFRRIFEEWVARCKMHNLDIQANKALGLRRRR